MEATWHGARVAVKRLIAPVRLGANGTGGSGGVGGGGGGGGVLARVGAPRAISAAAASAMRRQVRLLQALRFDFLVPIYGVSER